MANHTDPPADARGPAVEMPKPTVWPMVLALALALNGAGVALGTVAFLVIGMLLFVVSLCGWFSELLPGEGHEHEPLTAPLPTAVAARPGTVEQLRPGMAGFRFRLPERVHPISAGLKGGLAGGAVMPIPALAWGLLSGHGLWFPVNLLAGMVLPGVQSLGVPELEQFRPGLLAVAVVIHATMSAVIGLVYGVLLPTIPGPPRWQLVCGGLVIPAVWTGFSGALMGVANPVLQHHVDWVYFALSQLVFGLTAAVVVVRSEQVVVPPAGPGEPGPREGGRP